MRRCNLRLDFESSLDLQSLIVTVVGVYTGMRVKDMLKNGIELGSGLGLGSALDYLSGLLLLLLLLMLY